MSESILDNDTTPTSQNTGSDPTLSRLMAPDSPYWNRDHADHASAVEAVRTRHQQLSGEYAEPMLPDMAQTPSSSSHERRIAQLNAPASPLWKKGTAEAAAALAFPMLDRRLSVGVNAAASLYDHDRLGSGVQFNADVGLGFQPIEAVTGVGYRLAEGTE